MVGFNFRGNTSRRNSYALGPGKLRKVIKKCCQDNNSTKHPTSSGQIKCGSSENSSCINCYLRDGKAKKKAWACQHTDKLHYGKGMCGNCYHLAYYHRRRALLTGTQFNPKKEQISIEAVKVRSCTIEPAVLNQESQFFDPQEFVSTQKDGLANESKD